MLNVKQYLGSGHGGVVFSIDHNGRLVALKIQHSTQDSVDLMQERVETEFENLTRLSGINGIPKPIQLLTDIQGTYEELGLDQTGYRAIDVMPMHLQPHAKDYFLSGAFLFELIPDAKHLCYFGDNSMPSEFLDGIEAIMHEVHSRDRTLPTDGTSVVVSGHDPYIIDWHQSVPLSCNPDRMERDLAEMAYLRRRYQIRK